MMISVRDAVAADADVVNVLTTRAWADLRSIYQPTRETERSAAAAAMQGQCLVAEHAGTTSEQCPIPFSMTVFICSLSPWSAHTASAVSPESFSGICHGSLSCVEYLACRSTRSSRLEMSLSSSVSAFESSPLAPRSA
jgi:hypothetical protein